MKRYKEMVHTATICAFNPMIDDFLNARFFLGDAYGRRPPGWAEGEAASLLEATAAVGGGRNRKGWFYC